MKYLTIIAIAAACLASCDKGDGGKKKEVHPTRAEVRAEYKDNVLLQIENWKAVVELAVAISPPSLEVLNTYSATLPVGDIELQSVLDDRPRPGNALALTMREVMPANSKAAMTLDVVPLGRKVLRSQGPKPPGDFSIGRGFSGLLGTAADAVVKEPLRDPERSGQFVAPKLQEFLSLKYLIVIRTIAVKKSELLSSEGNKSSYSPGIYGGMGMLFDLQERTLLHKFPLVVQTSKGIAIGGAGGQLGLDVQARLKQIIASSSK